MKNHKHTFVHEWTGTRGSDKDVSYYRCIDCSLEKSEDGPLDIQYYSFHSGQRQDYDLKYIEQNLEINLEWFESLSEKEQIDYLWNLK